MKKIKLLALSGSLRTASYNTAALQALSKLSPLHIDVKVYRDMATLPLFNPDNEGKVDSVKDLKMQLAASQGLIIASPEYAHGITGVLKNTLDWLVSGEEFVGIPIMLLNTSPRATHAQTALREVLTTMSGNIVEKASIAVPLLGSEFKTDDIVQQGEMSSLLAHALENFYTAINAA